MEASRAEEAHSAAEEQAEVFKSLTFFERRVLMSEHFSGNDYDSYFRLLEEKLENERLGKNKPADTERQIPAPRAKNIKRKTIKLRKSAIAVCLVAVVSVVGTAVLIGSISNKKAETSDKQASDINSSLSAEKKEDKIQKTEFIFTDNTADIPSTNDAKYAIIIDKKDNSVIAQRKAKERAYPASTTKIMTLLTAVDLIEDYSDTFTMSLAITDPLFTEGASVAGFLDGEAVNMTDLLYGTILPSGADAAMGLAVKLAGSEEAFVGLMNKKAEELGLTDTHFDNVTGLHSENNYSTAYDMAIILDTALQNEICKKVLSTYQYTTASTSHHPEGILLSSTLFTYMYGTEPETATILGGKTGYVNESGYCIASYGENNESKNRYIVVTFGNSARMPAFFGQIDLYKEFAK